MNTFSKTLVDMFAELDRSPRIYQPSAYWQRVNAIQLADFKRYGFGNFKQSLNMRYFSWDLPGLLRYELWLPAVEMFRGNCIRILKAGFLPKQSVGNKSLSGTIGSFLYRIHIVALIAHISRIDRQRLLDVLEEPTIGNPFFVMHNGKRISQDLCHSIDEYYSIADAIPRSKPLRIAEIGAGYGRLAYVMEYILPNASYCIIDIPPALYMSQEYLSRVFPGEKIFFFRPFKSFQEIKLEFNASRIRFLLAHQIAFVPERSFDLVVNINSFDEMAPEQIKNYFDQIDRIARGGYFYTKQHVISRSKENCFIRQDQYPVPAHWETIYHRDHSITRNFFEALYRVRPQSHR